MNKLYLYGILYNTRLIDRPDRPGIIFQKVNKIMSKKIIKIFALVMSFLLIFEQSGFAQIAGQLDIAGHLSQLNKSLVVDKFRPLHLRYLSYDPAKNGFDLSLDKGDLRGLKDADVEAATKKILNYFFVGLAIPNDAFWVNLRPDSPDNIIDPVLEQTEAGRILLEADVQLKQDTARFTSPETPEGKEYWDRLYAKAGELFASSDLTIPTLTRPWIVPDEIIVRETPDNAYIYKATMKVMLEEDYLKTSGAAGLPGIGLYNFSDERHKKLNEYSSQLLRELIIPKMTREINTSKRYASLRQVYYSLIMAHWFKKKFTGSGGSYAGLIDSKDLVGLASQVPWSKAAYFKEYQRSFQQGEYNLKIPAQTVTGRVIRSYFSGGIKLGDGISGPYDLGLIEGNRNRSPAAVENTIVMRVQIGGGERYDITIKDLIGLADRKRAALAAFVKQGIEVKPGISEKAASPDAQDKALQQAARQALKNKLPSLKDIAAALSRSGKWLRRFVVIAAVLVAGHAGSLRPENLVYDDSYDSSPIKIEMGQDENGLGIVDYVRRVAKDDSISLTENQVQLFAVEFKDSNPVLKDRDTLRVGDVLDGSRLFDLFNNRDQVNDASNRIVSTLETDVAGQKVKIFFTVPVARTNYVSIKANSARNTIFLDIRDCLDSRGLYAMYKQRFPEEAATRAGRISLSEQAIQEVLYHEKCHNLLRSKLALGQIRVGVDKSLAADRAEQLRILMEASAYAAQLSRSPVASWQLAGIIDTVFGLGEREVPPQYKASFGPLARAIMDDLGYGPYIAKVEADRLKSEGKLSSQEAYQKAYDNALKEWAGPNFGKYLSKDYDKERNRFIKPDTDEMVEAIKASSKKVYKTYFASDPPVFKDEPLPAEARSQINRLVNPPLSSYIAQHIKDLNKFLLIGVAGVAVFIADQLKRKIAAARKSRSTGIQGKGAAGALLLALLLHSNFASAAGFAGPFISNTAQVIFYAGIILFGGLGIFNAYRDSWRMESRVRDRAARFTENKETAQTGQPETEEQGGWPAAPAGKVSLPVVAAVGAAVVTFAVFAPVVGLAAAGFIGAAVIAGGLGVFFAAQIGREEKTQLSGMDVLDSDVVIERLGFSRESFDLSLLKKVFAAMSRKPGFFKGLLDLWRVNTALTKDERWLLDSLINDPIMQVKIRSAVEGRQGGVFLDDIQVRSVIEDALEDAFGREVNLNDLVYLVSEEAYKESGNDRFVSAQAKRALRVLIWQLYPDSVPVYAIVRRAKDAEKKTPIRWLVGESGMDKAAREMKADIKGGDLAVVRSTFGRLREAGVIVPAYKLFSKTRPVTLAPGSEGREAEFEIVEELEGYAAAAPAGKVSLKTAVSIAAGAIAFVVALHFVGIVAAAMLGVYSGIKMFARAHLIKKFIERRALRRLIPQDASTLLKDFWDKARLATSAYTSPQPGRLQAPDFYDKETQISIYALAMHGVLVQMKITGKELARWEGAFKYYLREANKSGLFSNLGFRNRWQKRAEHAFRMVMSDMRIPNDLSGPSFFSKIKSYLGRPLRRWMGLVLLAITLAASSVQAFRTGEGVAPDGKAFPAMVVEAQDAGTNFSLRKLAMTLSALNVMPLPDSRMRGLIEEIKAENPATTNAFYYPAEGEKIRVKKALDLLVLEEILSRSVILSSNTINTPVGARQVIFIKGSGAGLGIPDRGVGIAIQDKVIVDLTAVRELARTNREYNKLWPSRSLLATKKLSGQAGVDSYLAVAQSILYHEISHAIDDGAVNPALSSLLAQRLPEQLTPLERQAVRNELKAYSAECAYDPDPATRLVGLMFSGIVGVEFDSKNVHGLAGKVLVQELLGDLGYIEYLKARGKSIESIDDRGLIKYAEDAVAFFGYAGPDKLKAFARRFHEKYFGELSSEGLLGLSPDALEAVMEMGNWDFAPEKVMWKNDPAVVLGILFAALAGLVFIPLSCVSAFIKYKNYKESKRVNAAAGEEFFDIGGKVEFGGGRDQWTMVNPGLIQQNGTTFFAKRQPDGKFAIEGGGMRAGQDEPLQAVAGLAVKNNLPSPLTSMANYFRTLIMRSHARVALAELKPVLKLISNRTKAEQYLSLHKEVAGLARELAGHSDEDFDLIIYPDSKGDMPGAASFSRNYIVTIDSVDLFDTHPSSYKTKHPIGIASKPFHGRFASKTPPFNEYVAELVILGADVNTLKVVERKKMDGMSMTTVEFMVEDKDSPGIWTKYTHTHFACQLKYAFDNQDRRDRFIQEKLGEILKGRKRVLVFSKAGNPGDSDIPESRTVPLYPLLPDGALVVSNPGVRGSEPDNLKLSHAGGSLVDLKASGPVKDVDHRLRDMEPHFALVAASMTAYGFPRTLDHLDFFRYRTKEGLDRDSVEGKEDVGLFGEEDVVLAAHGEGLPYHEQVHMAVEEGLPDGLKGYLGLSLEEKQGLKKKYRDASGRLVIPIAGLWSKTGLLGHIGLGQFYGEPVVYIDAVFDEPGLEKEKARNIKHEKFEIGKWEKKRADLVRKGVITKERSAMRRWIRQNSNSEGTGLAQTLAELWHRQAPPIDDIYAKRNAPRPVRLDARSAGDVYSEQEEKRLWQALGYRVETIRMLEGATLNELVAGLFSADVYKQARCAEELSGRIEGLGKVSLDRDELKKLIPPAKVLLKAFSRGETAMQMAQALYLLDRLGLLIDKDTVRKKINLAPLMNLLVVGLPAQRSLAAEAHYFLAKAELLPARATTDLIRTYALDRIIPGLASDDMWERLENAKALYFLFRAGLLNDGAVRARIRGLGLGKVFSGASSDNSEERRVNANTLYLLAQGMMFDFWNPENNPGIRLDSIIAGFNTPDPKAFVDNARAACYLMGANLLDQAVIEGMAHPENPNIDPAYYFLKLAAQLRYEPEKIHRILDFRDQAFLEMAAKLRFYPERQERFYSRLAEYIRLDRSPQADVVLAAGVPGRTMDKMILEAALKVSMKELPPEQAVREIYELFVKLDDPEKMVAFSEIGVINLDITDPVIKKRVEAMIDVFFEYCSGKKDIEALRLAQDKMRKIGIMPEVEAAAGPAEQEIEPSAVAVEQEPPSKGLTEPERQSDPAGDLYAALDYFKALAELAGRSMPFVSAYYQELLNNTAFLYEFSSLLRDGRNVLREDILRSLEAILSRFITATDAATQAISAQGEDDLALLREITGRMQLALDRIVEDSLRIILSRRASPEQVAAFKKAHPALGADERAKMLRDGGFNIADIDVLLSRSFVLSVAGAQARTPQDEKDDAYSPDELIRYFISEIKDAKSMDYTTAAMRFIMSLIRRGGSGSPHDKILNAQTARGFNVICIRAARETKDEALRVKFNGAAKIFAMLAEGLEGKSEVDMAKLGRRLQRDFLPQSAATPKQDAAPEDKRRPQEKQDDLYNFPHELIAALKVELLRTYGEDFAEAARRFIGYVLRRDEISFLDSDLAWIDTVCRTAMKSAEIDAQPRFKSAAAAFKAYGASYKKTDDLVALKQELSRAFVDGSAAAAQDTEKPHVLAEGSHLPEKGEAFAKMPLSKRRRYCESLLKHKLDIPSAQADVKNYLLEYLGLLGLPLDMIPEIAFVDTQDFNAYLYIDGNATQHLLLAKSGVGADGAMGRRVMVEDVVHEVAGHIFARRYVDFIEEANRETARKGQESSQDIWHKTIEEVLAWTLTFASFYYVQRVRPELLGSLANEYADKVGVKLDVLSFKSYAEAVVEDILSGRKEILERYKLYLGHKGNVEKVVNEAVKRAKSLLPGLKETERPDIDGHAAGGMDQGTRDRIAAEGPVNSPGDIIMNAYQAALSKRISLADASERVRWALGIGSPALLSDEAMKSASWVLKEALSAGALASAAQGFGAPAQDKDKSFGSALPSAVEVMRSLGHGRRIDDPLEVAGMVDELIKKNDNILIVGAGANQFHAVAAAVKKARIVIVQPPDYGNGQQQTVALKAFIERDRQSILTRYGLDIGELIDIRPGLVQDVSLPEGRFNFIFLLRVLDHITNEDERRRVVEKALSVAADGAAILVSAYTDLPGQVKCVFDIAQEKGYDPVEERVFGDTDLDKVQLIRIRKPEPAAVAPAQEDKEGVAQSTIDTARAERIEGIINKIKSMRDELNALRSANNMGELVRKEEEYGFLGWVLRLELLHELGVLQGNVVYPAAGNDYFLAYLTRLFTLNASISGIGVKTNLKDLENEVFSRGLLPNEYKGRKILLEIIRETDAFDDAGYFPKVLSAGGADAVLIKGFKYWSEKYNLHPGSESIEASKNQEQAIKGLLRKMDLQIIKEGGFIVIANKFDEQFADFIVNELGYEDYLARPENTRVKEALATDNEGHQSILGKVYISVGEVPIRILRKPNKKAAGLPSQGVVPSVATASPAQGKDDVGGIDFRSPQIVIQPVNAPGLIKPAIIPFARLESSDKEWQQIRNMLDAGIIPSGERIKEYLYSCCDNGGLDKEISNVISSLAQILRLEEDNLLVTSPQLKELLRLLESNKSSEDFKLALSGINFLSAEPELIAQ